MISAKEQKKLQDDLRTPFVKLAAKFDYQYMISDEFMCSETCPCWSPVETILANNNTDVRVDVEGKIMNMTEEMLNSFGRTKDRFNPDRTLSPLRFENRSWLKKNSFQTFEQCFEYWYE